MGFSVVDGTNGDVWFGQTMSYTGLFTVGMFDDGHTNYDQIETPSFFR